MTVGEGIFWGALVVAMVGLYATTKDRWKWKRIAKWGVGLPLLLLTVGAAGVWAYQAYEHRPQPQRSFGGLALASTAGDVRFAKGEPSEVVQEGLWYYYAGSGSAKPENAGYVVGFKDGKVRIIGYVATPAQIITPSLQGFSIGAAYDRVVDKLGPPDHVSTSPDGLQRMVSYSRLNTFYTFERAEVKGLGIYDPTTGPMEFRKAASAPAAPPSVPQPAASKADERWEDAPAAKPVLDHCAPGLLKAERLKRLAQHGTVRETGAGEFQAGGRTIHFMYDGSLAYCR